MSLSFCQRSFAMLDRQKLLIQLSQVNPDIFGKKIQEFKLAQAAWNMIKNDADVAVLLKTKKWSLLIPSWQGILGKVFDIIPQSHPYKVLAVDGSQIYYDRHQGPACYLINVGAVFFSYELRQSSVDFQSTPHVIMSHEVGDKNSVDYINLQREQAELSCAVEQASKIGAVNDGKAFICMFDGTLIFFQAEGQTQQKEQIFKKYMQHLQELYDKQILHVGYISFPKSQDLVNVLMLSVAEFDEKKLAQSIGLHRLTDMDIVQFFLASRQRSIMFESKASICYLYPKDLKPYFCYVNVGAEIARLEFPAWIAQDQDLVDAVCAVVLDQANKGNGYPVCLLEAHEQAVIKTCDREFFYVMMQRMTNQFAGMYQISKKSQKKASAPV